MPVELASHFDGARHLRGTGKGPKNGQLPIPSPDLAQEMINLQGNLKATIDSAVDNIFFSLRWQLTFH